MLCSLRLDIVHINEGWAWRIFHRQEGMNQSLSSPIPFNSDVSPVEIFNGFISASANNNVNELKDYGKWMWKKLFVDSISGYLESFTSGDILFAVPKEWADIPFELVYLPDNIFLGTKMAVGTIIIQNEKYSSGQEINTDKDLLIIADPSQNLKAAYEEGIFLKDLAIKIIKSIHLLTSCDKDKMNDLIKHSSIVHFAGRSFENSHKHTPGWELSSDVFYNLEDMENLVTFPKKPWLVFSNSCYAGNAGTELSGIAGAFMRAGVPQVLGPIKEVNDTTALKMAEIFYNNLFRGVSAAESLRVARIKLSSDISNGISVYLYRLFGDPCFKALSKIKKIKSNRIKINLTSRKWLFIAVVILTLILVLIVLLFPLGKESIIYIPVK